MLATLRRELFRTLLLQRIDFFDRHDPAELTALISTELDSLRALVFKCAVCAKRCTSHEGILFPIIKEFGQAGWRALLRAALRPFPAPT